MITKFFTRAFLITFSVIALLVIVPPALANHSWGPYHWARTSNPFNLKLGDNVSSSWDSYLGQASSDWTLSSVLNTSVVPGGTRPRNCRPTSGRVEVCNSYYGSNGWLGIAQIWITGGENITQGLVKLNDTYHNSYPYNQPAWRRLVMCQEIGHTFGLDHQDEAFGNPNLGTCMDYTSDPDGPPSNEHPNTHDYDQLEEIYSHLDSTSTVQSVSQNLGQSLKDLVGNPNGGDENTGENPGEWGRQVKDNGSVGLYIKELAGGRQLFTFVIWAR